MKERIPFTDSAGEQVASAAMRWGLVDKEPCDQIQPNIVVVLGHMTVLVADRLRLHQARASSIRDQLVISSCGVSPPQ